MKEPDGGRGVVLVVEDDDDVRDEIAVVLRQADYVVVEASHGGTALAYLEGTPIMPGAVVLDWLMPLVDGMTLLSHLASTPRYSAIPVVVLSAVAGRVPIPSLCVSALLNKPISARNLIAAVDRAVHAPERPEELDGPLIAMKDRLS